MKLNTRLIAESMGEEIPGSYNGSSDEEESYSKKPTEEVGQDAVETIMENLGGHDYQYAFALSVEVLKRMGIDKSQAKNMVRKIHV